MKTTPYLLIFILILSCSRKDNEPTPKNDNIPASTTNDTNESFKKWEEEKQKKEEEKKFLDNDGFFPTRETLSDIQDQIDDLKVKVLEYESRLSAPQFNTDILKKIKNPDLNHEIQMNNGNILQGSILEENLDQLIMSTQIGQITLSKSDIEDIRELSPVAPNLEFDGDFNEEIYITKRKYRGSIINSGKLRADFVRVIFTLHAEDTSVIASDSSFVDGSLITYSSGIISDSSVEPSQTVSYDVDVKIPKNTEVSYITKSISFNRYQ